jgi:octaprenyl-diphosphate synthase
MTTTLSDSVWCARCSPEPAPPREDVFDHLQGVCDKSGLDSLAGRLAELRAWLADDLAEVERALALAGAGDSLAHKSVRHLLDQDGKRLRPICVALAARVGSGFGPQARAYAVAVELVHNATLLHDDVVDAGDQRRGLPAARVVYGNAASIFGGDWLLIDALGRIQAAGQPDVMARMLDVVKEMVVAESWQLARRGKVRGGASEYFRIIDGKTASLFRWAMFAGARAGGAPWEAASALEAYGQKLGVAFQLVDDLLDFAGDPATTGKALLTDLREGKMTYPLILAMERDADLAPRLERYCAAEDAPVEPELVERIARAMSSAHVVEDCLALATKLCRDAIESLASLPAGRAKAALTSVALSVPQRKR